MNRIKIAKKIVMILVVLFITFSVFGQTVYASNIIQGADNFISAGQSSTKIDQNDIKNVSDIVYNILLALGVIISVIVGLILGIQFMTGSVEQKSKIKESLIPYIAGCVVIFGAFGIWKLVVNLLNQV